MKSNLFDFIVPYYVGLLILHSFLMVMIIKQMKNKPPLHITLVDLINIDYAYAYFCTCSLSVCMSLCIDAQYLSMWPNLALIISYVSEFVAKIFMQYISIGIIVRFMQIMQGHMEGFCGLLDEDVRLIIRIVTATLSKFLSHE